MKTFPNPDPNVQNKESLLTSLTLFSVDDDNCTLGLRALNCRRLYNALWGQPDRLHKITQKTDVDVPYLDLDVEEKPDALDNESLTAKHHPPMGDDNERRKRSNVINLSLIKNYDVNATVITSRIYVRKEYDRLLEYDERHGATKTKTTNQESKPEKRPHIIVTGQPGIGMDVVLIRPSRSCKVISFRREIGLPHVHSSNTPDGIEANHLHHAE